MKIKLIFSLFIILTSLQFGFSQTNYKTVMERKWNGIARYQLDDRKIGELYVSTTLTKLVYDENNNSFTAILTSSFKLENKIYKSVAKVSGILTPDTGEFILHTDSVQSKDDLTHGMQWSFEDVKLSVYPDEDNQGHYMISGEVRKENYLADAYQFSDMELSDWQKSILNDNKYRQ
ncbi:MAG: hypothetical protein PHC28_09235 [Flavobacterium sp.]|uniref:hypothetical protein n=1 Tax=Flavobacterium sp. TaxID=239 RepID=UPI002614A1AB|nr:hypothetical protein [Flavobacterium sp.]MDD5150652.1 hypothetical protein [Flavobacterium sp.]